MPGVVFGLLAGLMFAAAMMLIKSMGDAGVRGSTFALFYCLGSVILLTPLAVWQTVGSGYQLTWTDTWIVLVSGLVYTALCFSLFTDGMRYVRVEHAGILGYLEPVTSPLWAFLLIGEAPPWTTYAGGALIVAAGILVIVFGKGDAEPLAGAADVSGGRAAPAAAPAGRRRRRRRPRRRSACAATSRSASPASRTAPSASWSPTPTCRRPCCSACAWSFAAAALGMVVLATGSWRDLRTPGAPLRVLGISVALALNLILYFLAIRYTGVAVAIFLSYLAPVYLAFVAPRILKETDRAASCTSPSRSASPAWRSSSCRACCSRASSSRPPACSAAGRPASCTRSTCCSPRACAGWHVRSTPVVFAQSAFTAAVDAGARPARRQRRALPLHAASTC